MKEHAVPQRITENSSEAALVLRRFLHSRGQEVTSESASHSNPNLCFPAATEEEEEHFTGESDDHK